MRNAPLSVGFYADEDKSWADQDCLNLLPVKAELPGGRSELKLAPLAGLQEFASYPDASRQRGGHVVEGRQFMVIDQSLCQLLPSGAIQILGTIPGTSRCAFAHNQITNGNQLFIATGTSAYVWNTVTSTLAQVTDTGFMGGLLAKFIGARFVTVDPARRFFQWSDLADGTEWNSSNFDAGESSPDRIRSIEVMGDDLVLLNERTIDFFAYTGTTNATFERRPNSLDRGCAASHATVKVDNALFFIGNDGSGYLLRGYQLQRITTHPIEQKWAEFDLTKAFAFLHEFEGHKVVCVTFPNADQAGTWCYDVATGLWHRRESYGMDRWRLAWLTAWNGGYYGGEFNSGRVFVLNKRYPLEGSDCISREFSPGCLHQGGKRTMLDALRLIVERGPRVEASSVEPLAFSSDPSIVNNLPDGAVGDVVSFQYVTVGGISPITFAVTAGALPAGVTLNADTGAITGTYTTAEHDNAWTITATDSTGATATRIEAQYVLDMVGTPPNSLASTAYSYSLAGTDGEAPYTFALTSGSLPPGLTLSSAGLISGTTGATPATYPFSVTMTDDAGVDTVKPYGIQIVSASAAAIAPYILEWYAFDGTTASETTASGFVQTYGGGNAYSAGKKGQQMLVTQAYRAVPSSSLYNMDWSYCFWVDTSDHSVDNTTVFGSGSVSAFGTDPYAFVAVRTPASSAITAVVNLYDGTFHGSGGPVTPDGDGFVMFTLVYDNTAKTLTGYHGANPVAFGSATLAAVLEAVGTGALCAAYGAGTGAAAFASQHKSVDEWGVFAGYKLTAADITYLYNGGLGKSYDEVIADSVL